MNDELFISKLDAARRQLETAILLYFNESDHVSIHTITNAAYNILKDLTDKYSGNPMVVKGLMLMFIRDEYKDEMHKQIYEAENFFKHANRDAKKVLKFNPIQTEYLLLDACLKYQELTLERKPIFQVYQLWYMLNNPTHFLLPPEVKALADEKGKPLIDYGRTSFFSEILPIVLKLPLSRN